jgi:hypothetical protein
MVSGTGYTSQIITGKIDNFSDFAKICIRNFGACMHMRDEKQDAKYKLRLPSDYHLEGMKKERWRFKKLKFKPNNEILLELKNEFIEEIERCEVEIRKDKQSLKKLKKIYSDAKKWQPPTPEHYEFKRFVIEQLDLTLKNDSSFYENRIIDYKKKLSNLNLENIQDYKLEQLARIKESFLYHCIEYQKEVTNCEKANKWVTDLFNSLPVF